MTTGIQIFIVILFAAIFIARAITRRKRWQEKQRRLRDTAAWFERNRRMTEVGGELWGLSPMQYPVHGAGFGNDVTEE